MTPDLWHRLEPLFHAAMEQDASARTRFVEEVCGTDAELNQHLLQLIRAEEAGSRPPYRSADDGSRSFVVDRFQPGSILLGRFRIMRLLGKGGMGEVFEAEDLQLGRIALKTLRSEIASVPQAFERFRREVQIARKVSGPQVCRIHELFLLPATDQAPATAFLTMEYLDGDTLTSRIRESGPLPKKEALTIAFDICEGLRLIHQQGIVHRDLKSSNIMLCMRSGVRRAVLMDFGLAFESMRNAQASASTISTVPAEIEFGVIAGTPAYMAPEQFEGQAVSAASDIYALGVVLYELLTGVQPYAAATPVGAAIRRARQPAPVSSVQHKLPRHWDRVIERCLNYDPGKRFQSAELVARELRASPLTPRNLAADHPWLVRIIGILLLIMAAWGESFLWEERQYYRASKEAERWYQAGLNALHEGSYLKATRALENAIAQDSNFVMAHARLAEAWANLDFDGTAQREMLIATRGENHLPPIDRMYLEAIRATLTRDYKDGLIRYKEIRDRLPDKDKPAGYMDLGTAYERVDDPQHALENYAEASKRDPDNPAPWLKTGMVETRLNRMAEAEAAFSRAESLYGTEMNQEGQAELDYQRGYLASLSGRASDAESFLKHSIDEAQRISSSQLEIRALTQLSSIECASGHTDNAVAHATKAIKLARDRQQDAWAAMGLARLANARLVQGSTHYGEAEIAVNESRELAIETQQGRALALANVVLAALRSAEQLPAEAVKPASDALAYYRRNGYFEPAANATLLLLRAQMARGELHAFLQDSLAFLSLAQSSGNPYLVEQAEHNLGNGLDALERYPESLTHYQKALAVAGTDVNRGYEAIALSGALAKLGQLEEARAALSPVATQKELRSSVLDMETQELMMRADYAAAFARCEAALHGDPNMEVNDRLAFERRAAVAESHLGRASLALTKMPSISSAGSDENEWQKRGVALQQDEIRVQAGQYEVVRASAGDLIRRFQAEGQLDSALRTALIAATAAHRSHESSAYSDFAKQTVDILSTLQQTWGANDLNTYLSRPDLQFLVRSSAVSFPALK